MGKSIARPISSRCSASPQAYVVFTEGLIDDEGNITKEETQKFLQGFVDPVYATLIEALVKK